MGSPGADISWPSSIIESFNRSFDINIEEGNSSDISYFLEDKMPSPNNHHNIPKPPPLPRKKSNTRIPKHCFVPKETRDVWEKLFKEGYGADVHVITENGSIIPAHRSILSVASPVIGNILQQSKVKNGVRFIRILGVPYDAVCAFIRFLYSSCYEEEEMNKFVLHLLVLSHSYTVSSLKRICEHILEQGWLNNENVVDVLQLAKNCDTPRLALFCLRIIMNDFKSISKTEAWKFMKRDNPSLEQELLESVVEADSRKQERMKKIEERKVYLQLHEAMEALLHICREGCRTIGPRDKVLKGSSVPCGFPACKGLETLIRHFYVCKTKVPGGCVHCKRMWQLLELHSRMCNEPETCKVPLCRHFKVKMEQLSKKEEVKWKLLVRKVVAVKNAQKLFSPQRL
ncbi:hypothetical protein ABFS83_14G288100 [Erythranthe nasuta]